MKYISIIIVLVSLSFIGCEKVIDIELNETDPKVVIQGQLWEGTNDFVVNIKQSRSFYEQEDQAIVDNAMVTLFDGEMNPVVLENLTDGNYIAKDYVASAGNNYTIEVNIGEENYSATTFMPAKVVLDSIRSEFAPGMFGQEGGYLVFMFYQDTPGVNNYFRALSWKNGVEQDSGSDLWLNDSNFTDGNYITIPLFTQTFELGDTIDIRLSSIDSTIYDYYQTLAGIAGGGGGNNAAPANPNSNFSNGGLGFFGAFNGSEKQIIIEE